MKHNPFVESSCTESREGASFSSIMKEVRHLIFFNPSPASIVFISNPECVRYFRYQMMCLSTCEYNILLEYEYAHDFAPAHFLWKTLLEGLFVCCCCYSRRMVFVCMRADCDILGCRRFNKDFNNFFCTNLGLMSM